MVNSFSIQIIRDFVSLFFPRQCLACGESLVSGEETICTYCMLEMPQTDYHKDRGNPLERRIGYRIPIRYAMALFKFSKSGRVQNMLHQLKYKNHPEIGTMLGRVYGEKMVNSGLRHAFELIIPVPLHPIRQRKRGYNQSAKFAEGLSEKLEIPCSNELLKRRRVTETQTRKTKLNRWENMNGVFEVNSPELVDGRKILLVDDVVTTGSTLEACAQALLNSSCSELSIACIAEA